MNNTHQHKGKVILAGAGPGDPELITLKTIRYLHEADVVLADRLVSEDILKHHVNEDAKILHVGKQAGSDGSMPQALINELMVEFGLEGKLVVRLKGGDVSIFSNVLDELKELIKHGIPYEIIPGITSALGAAAYSGIPLTARGYSTSVRFLTYYKTDVVTDIYWKELAQTDDTLVFYMSCENLESLVVNLIKNNIAADKLMAVVEQATTPFQRVTVASLYDFEQNLRGKSFASPSILIIGKVVALHDQFAWLDNSHSNEFYFNPVGAKKIINTGKESEHVS